MSNSKTVEEQMVDAIVAGHLEYINSNQQDFPPIASAMMHHSADENERDYTVPMLELINDCPNGSSFAHYVAMCAAWSFVHPNTRAVSIVFTRTNDKHPNRTSRIEQVQKDRQYFSEGVANGWLDMYVIAITRSGYCAKRMTLNRGLDFLGEEVGAFKSAGGMLDAMTNALADMFSERVVSKEEYQQELNASASKITSEFLARLSGKTVN